MTDTKTALVLGGTGMVGRNLVMLLDTLDDWETIAVSRREPYFETRARHISCDMTEPNACKAGLSDLIKLEVIGDDQTLFPDVEQLQSAAASLVRDGFTVLPYCNDDPITCKKLEDLGCAAVMPLGAPIGSGMGIRNPYNIQIIRDRVSLPLIVDAGVGTASDATVAMELGCDGVLLNTAVAKARQPVLMAEAMRKAIEAGRLAFLAGRIPRKLYATASSPLDGMI